MPFDFPSSPSVGDIANGAGGIQWRWDGTKWVAIATGGPFVALAGDTMTGPLTLAADPATALQAATKNYVDTHVPTGGPFLPLSGGALTNTLTISAPANWTQYNYANDLVLTSQGTTSGQGTLTFASNSANSTYRNTNFSFIRYGNALYASTIDATSLTETDLMYWTTTGTVFMANVALTTSATLTLAVDPTTNMQAATKQYVDAHAGGGGSPGPAGSQLEQFVDLSGLATADIQVPTWAMAAEISGFAYFAAFTWMSLRVSFDGTTFNAGASDYQNVGAEHATGTDGWTTLALSATDGMYLTISGDDPTLPQSFNAEFNVTRPAATQLFHLKTYARQYTASNPARLYRGAWLTCYPNANLSTALAIKALRLLAPSATFAAGSWIRVRWLGDISKMPAGIPEAPTDGQSYTRRGSDASWQVAGTGGASGVSSFNTRTGAVTLTLADVTGVGGAPLASPAFTGTPSLPTGTTGITQTAGNSTTALATTAFVTTALGGATGGATVGDVAPASPSQGALWWDSIGGQMYVRYVDANSSQWVIANSQAPGVPDAPNDANTYARHAAAWVASPTNASVAAAVAPALNAVGRNLLHNGLMNVTQRGAGPWTTVGTPVYTADRWGVFASAGSTQSTSVSVTTTGNQTDIGDEAAAKTLVLQFTGTATAGSIVEYFQRIEGVRRLSNKTVTVSLWGWTASGTLNMGISLDQSFGTGGSPSANVTGTPQIVTLSTTAQRRSATFTLPSVAGKTLGTNGDDYVQLCLYVSGATGGVASPVGVQSGTIGIWGVQLELGPTATPLEKLDPRIDLANAQRFYQTVVGYLLSYATAGQQVGTSVVLPVVMRGTPTVTPSGSNSGGNTGAITYFPTSSQLFTSAIVTVTGGASWNVPLTLSADL
ncbi:MAG TPA: hypothetical protein VGF65_11250 [Mycobacterium sp.]|jgi:hypothetical protein